MDIDINVLRGIATLLVMLAFLGLCGWAYSSKRKTHFDEAAQIPFADDTRDGSPERPGNSPERLDSSPDSHRGTNQ